MKRQLFGRCHPVFDGESTCVGAMQNAALLNYGQLQDAAHEQPVKLAYLVMGAADGHIGATILHQLVAVDRMLPSG